MQKDSDGFGHKKRAKIVSSRALIVALIICAPTYHKA